MTYHAPIRDIRFTLDHVIEAGALARGFPDLNADVVEAVLEEAGRFAAEIIAPLNAPGDRAGCRLENGKVTTAPGYAAAYRRFVAAGWNGIAAAPQWGGQGLPKTLACAVDEMWHGAAMAFALCPLLTRGAIELLTHHGTDEQQLLYLPRLVSGTWTGTMNLTEPQAGSDVGAVKTRAVRAEGGTYRITGTKIFITYGEHDMAENIVHLVLARLPDAAEGTKGISLFIVPKFLARPDGTLGAHNDLRCLSIEHKLGIHASPTCVMVFGENEGAIGTLVGAEHGGMRAMFTMMNNARLGVGLEGVGIAEAATQKALAFAQGRVQGRTFEGAGPILQHPDVARMLLTMKSLTGAARAICYATARAIDEAGIAENEEERSRARARENFLTPIAKAFSTDIGIEVASLGIQVHGGMGYIEETGAAQLWRDSRIAAIYEGTNGIQALDLVSRKLGQRGGEAVRALIAEIAATGDALARAPDPALAAAAAQLVQAASAMRQAGDYLQEALASSPANAFTGACAYLRLAGLALGGHFLARGALASLKPGPAFAAGRRRLALFHLNHLLPQCQALKTSILAGGACVERLDPAELAH
jgi:alkylation response protein AidB-like acyl-CoA dehydrogenase